MYKKNHLIILIIVSVSAIVFWTLLVENRQPLPQISQRQADPVERFGDALNTNPSINLKIIKTCGQTFFRIVEFEPVQPYTVEAELRSVIDEKLLAKIALFTARPMQNPPRKPDRGWVRLDDAGIEKVKLVGFICDKDGERLSNNLYSIIPSSDVQTVQENAVSSVALDDWVRKSSFTIEAADTRRWLRITILQYANEPREVGFGASLDGLDAAGSSRFHFIIAKPNHEALDQMILLTETISTEDCDSVTQIRLHAVPCIAALGGDTKEVWNGTVTVSLPPHAPHVPSILDRYPRHGLVPDDTYLEVIQK